MKYTKRMHSLMTAMTFAMAIPAIIPASAGRKPAAGAPVTAKVTLDKRSYSVHSPIKLMLTARNTSREPVKMIFSSGMKYDFEIRSGKTPTGEQKWQWSRGRMFTMMVQFSTLEPGKSLIFSETYSPGAAGPDGKPLPDLAPGDYTAVGVLTVSGRAPRPIGTTTFTVK